MSKIQNEPVRILHVVTNMSYGGLENLLMNYYRNINREKVQFDFLTHVDIHQDFEEEIQAMGGKIYRLPRLNPFSPFYRKKLNDFLNQHLEYNIIHCHLDCLAGIPLKAAKDNNIQVRIAHSHSSSQNLNWKYIIKMLYKPKIIRYATDLFACGDKAGNWMFNGKPYTIMRNAIDAKQFRYTHKKSVEEKEKLNLNGKLVIGHVGQFRQEKNQIFLVDVFAELIKKEENCVLIFVGKGPKMEEVKHRAKELGVINQVLFLGARSDIADLMQAMDIFVLPSIYEGVPVTMIEAQAAGLPCIISSGVPEECKLTNNVVSISLTDEIETWTKAILKQKNHVRNDNYDIIVKAGFDITTNAHWLEEFYLKQLN